MKSPIALSQAARDKRLGKWAAESGVELSGLDVMQRGVVLVALTFLSFVMCRRCGRWCLTCCRTVAWG